MPQQTNGIKSMEKYEMRNQSNVLKRVNCEPKQSHYPPGAWFDSCCSMETCHKCSAHNHDCTGDCCGPPSECDCITYYCQICENYVDSDAYGKIGRLLTCGGRKPIDPR
jgi:hypothetical protein